KHRLTLEQQMSSLVNAGQEDPQKQEEEVRKRDEKEIQDDYRDREGEQQDREIEHLLLVTHGIGQRLGLRMESVNFVGDVNTLRKTLKAVYSESADLQALNSEVNSLPKNCRIQVLPINWRHKLDFPNRALKHNRKEHDLAFGGFGEEEDYPNLDNISVEGVPAVRNLITDLALDILLYQSPAYKDAIASIVLEECNRIYKLFCERNPSFKGKVSLVGHSLGSAIMFDILCLQERHESQQKLSGKAARNPMKLDFEVEDFYALGSPIGLFQMLKGRTISARDAGQGHMDSKSAAFLGSTSSSSDNLTGMGTQNSDLPVSSPKCRQVFNIFHPTDPISYRIEPLISPAMSSLKPQPLPYTKRGIFSTATG
ncbi:DDHD-domain-containing protein, partial [Aureobasidium melanogenum]